MKRAVGLVRAFDNAAEELGRQVVRFDTDLRADDDQPLDQIAQLAHVAGPWIAKKNFKCTFAEFASFFSVSGTEFIQEMASQDGDVRGAIAEWRNEKRNDVETVEKVLAKTAMQNFLFEILIRGGKHADIDATGLVRADRFEALLFEHAQHFGLRAETHIADFIEEESAAIGLLKLANFVVAGAGEAAFDVAEKFGFYEFFGNCRAIDLNEGALVAEAGCMK